jgi:enamine deaminase RidA (YjgF/YER057c/UK114 family)
VHGEVFKHVRPAATLVVVARLIEPTLLVEIEAEARRA